MVVSYLSGRTAIREDSAVQVQLVCFSTALTQSNDGINALQHEPWEVSFLIRVSETYVSNQASKTLAETNSVCCFQYSEDDENKLKVWFVLTLQKPQVNIHWR